MKIKIKASNWSESSTSIVDDIRRATQQIENPISEYTQFIMAETQRKSRECTERIKKQNKN